MSNLYNDTVCLCRIVIPPNKKLHPALCRMELSATPLFAGKTFQRKVNQYFAGVTIWFPY